MPTSNIRLEKTRIPYHLLKYFETSYCSSCYVCHSLIILSEIRRVLRPDGVVFWNIADSYSGSGQGKGSNHGKAVFLDDDVAPEIVKSTGKLKPKDLCLIPFRVAIAAQEDGWYIRSVIIWNKPNPMPESVHGSYYIRHYVTIEEYERLQSLRIAESGNKDGASDLPGMQEGKVSGSQTALSKEREGSGNGKGERATPGSEREETVSQPNDSGTQKQSKIRGDRKGKNYTAKGDKEVFCQIGNQTEGSRETSQDEKQTGTYRTKETSESTLLQDREGQGQEIQGLCQTEGCVSSRRESYSRRLAGDIEKSQESLSLLPQKEDIDNRPRNSNQQGRQARKIEHSASLPELQRQETGQLDSAFIECPGCSKCDNGYIHINGSGRPTDSHEYILMLTKSSRYYWDQEAVREEYTEPLNRWGGNDVRNSSHKYIDTFEQTGDNGGIGAIGKTSMLRAGAKTRTNPAGRNLRNVWTFSTQPFKGAHFATFPEKLPETCIKAATPEYGCCSECGKPWERIVKRTEGKNQEWAQSNNPTRKAVALRGEISVSTSKLNRGSKLDYYQNSAKVQTLGWQPGCKCNTDVIPSIVLDPFAGSGTTLKVAAGLGRRAVGYELSEEYCKLAVERNKQAVL